MKPNLSVFLNFESPNKADYLIAESKWELPYHVQTYIRNNLQSPESDNLLPFLHKAFGRSDFDKRSEEFKNGRSYLLRIKNRGTECYNFTDEQILHIIKFSRSKKPIEMLRDMFPGEDGQKLNGLCHWVKELQAVWSLEYLGEADVYEEIEEIEDYGGHYVSPKTDETIVSKINRYCPGNSWSKWKLDPFQKKCVRTLKGNLNLMRFGLIINSFKNPKERQLFEGEFIRSTFDKPDMINDDINLCMMLAEEYVRSIQIREIMNLLDLRLRACLEGDEKQGNQIALAEQHKAKSSEFDKCNANIKALTKSLNDTRNKRVENETKFNDSIARYVNACCDAQKRQDLINQKKAYETNILKKEIDKIEETDQVIGEIHGISIDEVLGFKHQITE